ncbi:hypothetical protein NKI56_19150 [Mesorhizobium sp. M0622]|uniref:hypothetical protein n=1 Tax=unclassified Mesorhizobium TaxID=325217 RepID=UPI003334C19F
MDVRILITKVASSTRDFFWPRYRPELYYMRGAGPATARRAVMVRSGQVLPTLREEQRQSLLAARCYSPGQRCAWTIGRYPADIHFDPRIR